MYDLDTLIIGSGPAALSLAVHMAIADPDSVKPDRCAVVDPSGEWLSNWDQQMRDQGIAYLRSPAVHHPHPSPFVFMHSVDEDRDIIRPDRIPLPSTESFRNFCDQLIEEHQLQDLPLKGYAEGLTRYKDGLGVLLGHGAVITARRVVTATNPRVRVVPDWATGLPEHITCQRPSVEDVCEGERIVVVGGGLSAANLALSASDRGALVTLLARRDIVERRMDVDPRWVSTARLGPFLAADVSKRPDMIRRARGGGSVPVWVAKELRKRRHQGKMLVHQNETVASVDVVGEGTCVHTTGGASLYADRLWLATGASVDVTADPVLADALELAPTEIHGGLPVLNDDLNWRGLPLWITGSATALYLGPLGGNLFGFRQAADRIVKSWGVNLWTFTEDPDALDQAREAWMARR